MDIKIEPGAIFELKNDKWYNNRRFCVCISIIESDKYVRFLGVPIGIYSRIVKPKLINSKFHLMINNFELMDLGIPAANLKDLQCYNSFEVIKYIDNLPSMQITFLKGKLTEILYCTETVEMHKSEEPLISNIYNIDNDFDLPEYIEPIDISEPEINIYNKRTRSESLKGNQNRKGKSNRKVYCIETGKTYRSIHNAAVELGIPRIRVYKSLRYNMAVKGYTFKEVD